MSWMAHTYVALATAFCASRSEYKVCGENDTPLLSHTAVDIVHPYPITFTHHRRFQVWRSRPSLHEFSIIAITSTCVAHHMFGSQTSLQHIILRRECRSSTPIKFILRIANGLFIHASRDTSSLYHSLIHDTLRSPNRPSTFWSWL